MSEEKSPEITIHCTYDKMVAVDELKPNPKNPYQHPSKQIKLLGEIIKGTGWRKAIVVSNLSGFIVSGHGRLEAALLLGMTEVPVDYQDYASEAEEHADLVADNKLPELSEIDDDMMADVLKGMKDFDHDISMTALNPLDLNRYLSEEKEGPSVSVPPKEKNIIIKVSVHPAIWLSKREEITNVFNNLKATYDAGFKIKE